jgi:hypothetical protein
VVDNSNEWQSFNRERFLALWKEHIEFVRFGGVDDFTATILK